jgi:hypothetical protein
MKKLVLGLLIAAASSAGCSSDTTTVVTPTDTPVSVSWTFKNLEDSTVGSCPTGYPTATIVSQSIDPTTHLGTGLTVRDQFDCSAGHGTITLPADTFLVWVEITDANDKNPYAQTEETFVDTSAAVPAIDTEVLNDGGYIQLTWDLVDSKTHALVSCKNAGVGANGSVEVTPTLTGSNALITDKFTCDDHFGTTAGLLSGNYTISVAVNATDNASDPPLGDPQSVPNISVEAPSVITYVGNIMLPID